MSDTQTFAEFLEDTGVPSDVAQQPQSFGAGTSDADSQRQRRQARDGGGGPSRAQIRADFPWMPEELIGVFIRAFDEHGNARAALRAVRDHPSYDRHFPGNRRQDGSFRFSEADYVRQDRAIRTTLDRLDIPVANDDAIVQGAIESELDGRQFAQALGQTAEMLTRPGQRPPGDLLREFSESLSQTGSPRRALQATRDSEAHRQMFPGIRREDGSLRMGEQEYFQTTDAMRSSLASRNLNPQAFEGRIPEMIEGEVSPREFEARLSAVEEEISGNLEEVRQFYADNYGLNMTREAILGSAIDPDVNRAVLERRISAAQIGGEALRANFERSRQRAEELAQAGVGQEQARQLYSRGRRRVPQIQTLIDRFNDPGDPFGIKDFEEVVIFGDPDVQQRIERRVAEERSLFSPQRGRVASEGGRLTGLRRR